jgi:hypothetical protein
MSDCIRAKQFHFVGELLGRTPLSLTGHVAGEAQLVEQRGDSRKQFRFRTEFFRIHFLASLRMTYALVQRHNKLLSRSRCLLLFSILIVKNISARVLSH